MTLKIEKKEYIGKTFRMPSDLVEDLAAVAQQNDVSMTQLVIMLCKYGLENLDDASKPNDFKSI